MINNLPAIQVLRAGIRMKIQVEKQLRGAKQLGVPVLMAALPSARSERKNHFAKPAD